MAMLKQTIGPREAKEKNWPFGGVTGEKLEPRAVLRVVMVAKREESSEENTPHSDALKHLKILPKLK